MKVPGFSEAVASAIVSGDVAQLETLYQPYTALNEMAKHAARHGQPQILQWCCAQGWRPSRDACIQSSIGNYFTFDMASSAITIFQILVEHGMDIKQRAGWGDVLHLAILFDRYEFAEWLLEHGHPPKARGVPEEPDAFMQTICSGGGNRKMTQMLLDHDYELDGLKAGVKAAEWGNADGLKMLLDHGVDIEERDVSSFQNAQDDDDDLHEALKDAPYNPEGTALWHACRKGNDDCVALLLERGADPRARNQKGVSCIDIARHRAHNDVVRRLRLHLVKEDDRNWLWEFLELLLVFLLAAMVVVCIVKIL